jgi:hypothetical protein
VPSQDFHAVVETDSQRDLGHRQDWPALPEFRKEGQGFLEDPVADKRPAFSGRRCIEALDVAHDELRAS